MKNIFWVRGILKRTFHESLIPRWLQRRKVSFVQRVPKSFRMLFFVLLFHHGTFFQLLDKETPFVESVGGLFHRR